MNSKSLSAILLIFLLGALAAVFVYPADFTGGFANKVLPWRLGLDLIGGSELIYEVEMSGVEAGDRDSVMGGLRDVIERRVNLFGVSEPNVVVLKSGDSHRLLVELAGIKDVREAIQQIGETPFLFFSETEKLSNEEKEKAQDGEGKQPEIKFVSTALTGRYVKKAQMVLDQVTGRPQIFLEFNDEGAVLF